MKPAKLTLDSGKEIYFKAAEVCNAVHIEACDKDGNRLDCGTVVGIHSDGAMRRYPSVNASIGLPLNANGKLKKSKG